VFGLTEDFPSFTHVYFETPAASSKAVTVLALLDGPSLAGAFRFVMRRDEAVVMDIEKALYLRRDVARLGIAPLTSMYWYSETAKPTAIDWRPEIHDSDGLSLWTGAGERIWRPINNPPRTTASAFADERPRGFGLMQRDRAFDHYLDGVYYDRRPSLWVEPLNDWGAGSVQLIEIPTDDEIHDNIVALWVPAEPARAGAAYEFRYRLHWVAGEPYPPALAQCVATRMGNGGQAGTMRPKGVRKFIVEFKGEPLTRLAEGVLPEPVLSASRGAFSNIRAEAVPNDVPGHWRAEFDLAVTGAEPVELRCYLKSRDEVLSETWLYQHHPAF
jgi:glucans biosynthesis protein